MMDRRERHRRVIFLALAGVAWATACSDGAVEPPPPPPPEPARPTSITVEPSAATLTSLGETAVFRATVKDQRGAAFPGTVTWSSSDEAVFTVDAGGTATAVANGSGTLTATLQSLSAAAAVEVAQEPASLEAVSGDGQAARPGAVLPEPVVVRAVDAGGAPVEGVTVAFAAGEGHGTADPAEVATDTAGLARTVWTLGDAAGMQTLAASVADGPSAEIAARGLTAVEIVHAIEIVSGDGQTADLGAALDDSVVVRAVDAEGAPVERAAVAFTLGEGHGKADPAETFTDSEGLARTLWILGKAIGEQTLRATVGNVSMEVMAHAINPDRAALVALYEATDGPNWVSNENWLTDAPLGEWYGVATDTSGRITELGLNENALVGPIPPELDGLTNLQRLDLSNNGLTGSIPPELGSLTGLEFLNLPTNKLTGTLPPELGRLSNLSWLQLSTNALEGPIPPEWGGLTNLNDLYLFNNEFTGALPKSLMGLASLRAFSFGSNAGLCSPGTADFVEWIEERSFVNGPYCHESDMAILQTLFETAGGTDWSDSGGWLGSAVLDGWHGVSADSLGHVTGLDLGGNGLAGRLPPNLGDLLRMTELRIGDNADLTGRLPLSLARLSLRVLHYAGTGLCIPTEAAFREWLTTIPLQQGTAAECSPLSDRAVLEALYDATGGTRWTNQGNWLSDVPLNEWYGVRSDDSGRVTDLDLRDNNLAGALPPDLGRLANLRQLNLSRNGLTGSIPPELGHLPNLTWLGLGGNRLSGPIPLEFDGLDSLRYLDLGWNRLTGSIPPELGRLSNLTGLVLGGNDLTGGIPPELGNLSNLTGLVLGGNRLFGPIPLEFDGLGSLRQLDLGPNRLTGSIPPELGRLSNLTRLNLGGNDLTGGIPRELGNLANLSFLNLSGPQYIGPPGLTGPIPAELANLNKLGALFLNGNALTGGIPPELGNLANLSRLDLNNNQLSGGIPPELGNLANLSRLDLNNNQLSGGIPPELGNLSALALLLLSVNDLEGPLPPQLGRLASLRELALSRNPRLSGTLPQSLTALGQLETFVAQDTDLCAPSDTDFLSWLNGITVQRVAVCGGTTATAYLTQAVQSPEFPVPLVAGEEALLRVFVTARRSNDEDIPPVRAKFFASGAETHVLDIPRKRGPIPMEVQEGDLETSANASIPGRFVRPGLEMVIEIDPGGTLDPALGVTKRIPETGRLAVDVRPMPVVDLTLIPFLWTGSSDSSIVDITRDLTPESDLLREIRTLLPVADFEVKVHAPVSSSSNNPYDLLRETRAIRVMEGGSGHYMGTMAQPVTGPRGLAGVPGRTSFSVPTGWVMAHELGHNMSLRHPWENPSFPSYPDGRIGAWGYDFRDGGRLISPDALDIMLGCCWISDFHFAQALRFRESEAATVGAIRVAEPTPARSLLLWGGIDTDGAPYLEPAFVVEAPAALPGAAGEYRITGRTNTGAALFSFSFDMPATADAGGEESSFVFTLPVQADWADDLAGITLSGPGGSVTLDDGTDRPMAILRDPGSGQVRAFLSDPAAATQAAAAGGGTAQGMEVLFSRGIPSAEVWRR